MRTSGRRKLSSDRKGARAGERRVEEGKINEKGCMSDIAESLTTLSSSGLGAGEPDVRVMVPPWRTAPSREVGGQIRN